MANKGLRALMESESNFSNQSLENAVNEIKNVDKDDGYLWIKSAFDMDTAIHDNTVLTTSQKNDALETLYAAQPHLQIGRYLNDTIRHTNTILDGSILPVDSSVSNPTLGTFLEILQLVHSLQTTILEMFGVAPSEKGRSVQNHLGILDNMFTRTEDSSAPAFTRLKEIMELIDASGRTTVALQTATAAVRYSNTQLVDFLSTIVADSTDFQTSLDNRVNTAAGNMANLQTRISQIAGDPTVELIAIRDKIVTQQTLEISNITTLRTYIDTISDKASFTSLAENDDLRKLLAIVAQNINWQTYFNDYLINETHLNPMYDINSGADRTSVIDLVLESRGLPDVTDHLDFIAVANKAKKDSRIDTKNYDYYTNEEIITKSCEQLGITTTNRSSVDKSKSLLKNMNDNDRALISNELDLNESANTIN